MDSPKRRTSSVTTTSKRMSLQADKYINKVFPVDVRTSGNLILSQNNAYDQNIACVVRGTPEKMELQMFQCKDVPQLSAGFIYDKYDEVISKFVQIKFTGQEDYFEDLDNELYVSIPHCLSRSSAMYREAVIKAKINNAWVYMNTEEAGQIDDYKDVRFVQAKLGSSLPSFICVVSRFKQDVIKFNKQPSRNVSSVDQRLTIKSEYGCFNNKKTYILTVQPVDTATVARLQSSAVNGRSVIGSSNIVTIDWQGSRFKKLVQVNLPVPPNPVKMKKLMAKNEVKADEEGSSRKRKIKEQKDDTKTKWYMGIYGDDENDVLYLFAFEPQAESWTYISDVTIVELRKDLLSFQLHRPLFRFLVLRCRVGFPPVEARKLVYTLEDELLLRPVRFILYQSPKEHSEITVHCVNANKYEVIYEELFHAGWRFYGTAGPPSSKQVYIKEGSTFEVSFRGNIKFEDRYHSTNKRVQFIFNSQIPNNVYFVITEADKHLQKSYDFFKGLCLIHLLNNVNPERSTSSSRQTSKQSVLLNPTATISKKPSNAPPDQRKLLCQLIIQLAKSIERGPQTPPAQRLPLDIDPVYTEAIKLLSAKLGKEWEVLAKNLGLTRGRIEALKTRNKRTPDIIKEDMLYTWIKRQPRAAERLPILYHALMNCGRIDLAYKMEDLYVTDTKPVPEPEPEPEELPPDFLGSPPHLKLDLKYEPQPKSESPQKPFPSKPETDSKSGLIKRKNPAVQDPNANKNNALSTVNTVTVNAPPKDRKSLATDAGVLESSATPDQVITDPAQLNKMDVTLMSNLKTITNNPEDITIIEDGVKDILTIEAKRNVDETPSPPNVLVQGNTEDTLTPSIENPIEPQTAPLLGIKSTTAASSKVSQLPVMNEAETMEASKTDSEILTERVASYTKSLVETVSQRLRSESLNQQAANPAQSGRMPAEQSKSQAANPASEDNQNAVRQPTDTENNATTGNINVADQGIYQPKEDTVNGLQTVGNPIESIPMPDGRDGAESQVGKFGEMAKLSPEEEQPNENMNEKRDSDNEDIGAITKSKV